LEGRLHSLCSNPLNFFSTSAERNLAIANFRRCCQRHKYVISAAAERVLGPEPAAGDGLSMVQEGFHDQGHQQRLVEVEGGAAAQDKAEEERVTAETIAEEERAAAARLIAEETHRQEQLEQERQAREQDEGEQDDDAMIDDLSKLLLG
jgi:hypothetical protein